jgi:anti-sigma regulatory factor (Ser/Thr protein kinase)
LPGTARLTAHPPPPRRFLLELAAETASLPVLAAFAASVGLEAGFDERRCGHLQLALEEIAMNLVMHGGPQPGSFQVRALLEPAGLRLEVLDTGDPFPFEQAASAYPGLPAPERPVGGLGLFLAGKFMDEVRYRPGTWEGNRMELLMRRS